MKKLFTTIALLAYCASAAYAENYRVDQKDKAFSTESLTVKVGDTVFDGSVRHQLEEARASMLDRSTHEIQSGRDRFSTASGN